MPSRWSGAEARSGIATLDAAEASLIRRRDEEEALALPAVQERSAAFGADARTITSEGMKEMDAIGGEAEIALKSSVADADAAAADAIRESLKPKQ